MRAVLLLVLFFGSAASTVAADSCALEAAVCTNTGSVTVEGVTLENVCLNYTRVETCTRETRVAECGALETAAVTKEPLASEQCQLTRETCTRETAGMCDRVERDYTCLDGPIEATPAVLQDRRFTDFEERMENTCAEDLGASCTYFSSQVTQGGGTRNINEKHVTRSWWERSRTYNCDDSGTVNSCSPYEDSPVCRQSSEPQCQSYFEDGSCAYAAYTYTCESDTSFTAECDSVEICADGQCEGAPEEASSDYAEASAWLNLLDDMADKNQCDAEASAPVEEDGVVVDDCQDNQLDGGHQAPEVFKGEYLTCRRGNTNCCDLDGEGSCSPEEDRLANRRIAGAAHYLGMTCNRFLGICVSVDEYWCAYSSKFARVFQEEAHVQTGSQFLYPSANPCPALSISDLETIDFDQMDLSEIYGDMLNQAGAPVEVFIVNQLETELGMFEGNVQNTLQ